VNRDFSQFILIAVLPRFFAPGAGRSAAESVVSLPEDESAHIARVLRLRVGDSIRVFDGAGGEWRAEITEIARHRVSVMLREAVTPAREPRIPVLVAVAVLKGDKMDAVVRDAVMLGAAAIQPLIAERTEYSVSALTRGRRTERWQRIAIASCKQCGRAVVPRVDAPQEFEAWMARPPQGTRVCLVEPTASARARAIHEIPPLASAELTIGPEGGWTVGEINAAQAAGAELVTLGAFTLRADAVPVVALTAVRTAWRDW
jgi:16S rRNA (uracil1498-N3)-methyltransferase